MVTAWQACVAEASPAPPRFWDPRLFAATLVLVGVILLGALVIYCLDRWRKRAQAPSLTANDQLANFRELYEQGDISHREFERIKGRLAPLLREQLNVPESKSAGETSPANPVINPPAPDNPKVEGDVKDGPPNPGTQN
jgi:hypothetical protein